MKSRALRFLMLTALAFLHGGCAALRPSEPVWICGNMLFLELEDEDAPCTGTRDQSLDAPATPPDGD
jgi:hypothetical protein